MQEESQVLRFSWQIVSWAISVRGKVVVDSNHPMNQGATWKSTLRILRKTSACQTDRAAGPERSPKSLGLRGSLPSSWAWRLQLGGSRERRRPRVREALQEG